MGRERAAPLPRNAFLNDRLPPKRRPTDRQRKPQPNAEKQAFRLLGIALAFSVGSIGFGIFHLRLFRHSDASLSPYFEAPTKRKTKRKKNTTVAIPRVTNAERKPMQQHQQHPNFHINNPQHQTPPNQRRLRYDTVGPKAIPGSGRSHALPNAVPVTNTIPRSMAENKSYHIAQRSNTSLPLSMHPWPPKGHDSSTGSLLGRYNWNHTYHDDFRTLYLYNPSILALHNTLPRNNEYYSEDPDALSPDDLHALTGEDPSVRYLATFRAYLGCNCFGPNKNDRILMTAGEQISYLALALLDENLDLVEGTDVLIDLNAGPNRGLYYKQWLEDCRVFLMRGAIYLLCNEQLKRVRIQRTRHGSAKQTRKRDDPYLPPGYASKNGIRIPYVYPNVHGDGLEVTLVSHHTKVAGGKNLNIFRATRKSESDTNSPPRNDTQLEEKDSDSGNTTSSNAPIYQHYLQTYPAPHKYRNLHMPDGGNPQVSLELNKIFKDPVSGEWSKGTKVPGILPKPSFETPDAEHNITRCQEDKTLNCTDPFDVPFFGDEDDHGTSCCVRVRLPPNTGKGIESREVLVGITHQKLSPRKNFWLLDVHHRYEHLGIDRFVSRFVAYNTEHPFDVVARSGWFCLGFANETDPVEREHPHRNTLAGHFSGVRLDLFDSVYDCPVIHFASGFSEVVGNSSRAIIGYGVNDCYPRMFMVEKAEIVRLLTTA